MCTSEARDASAASGIGHSWRVTCSFSGRAFRSCVASDANPERQSLARGVANNNAWPSRLGRTLPLRPAAPPRLFPYGVAVGVAHWPLAASVSVVPGWRPLSVE